MTEELPDFLKCIEWLRSDDALTFENGYHALMPRARQFRDEFVRLLQAESEPRMRARLVELLGDTEDPISCRHPSRPASDRRPASYPVGAHST